MRRLTLACVAVAVLAHGDAAWCQEGDELDRWVPSLGFSAGFITQGAEGFQQSNLRPPDDELPPPGPFPGTPSTGSGSLVDASVVFAGELMTPGIRSLPGSPRLFVHGDAGADFGSEIILASEGSPGPFVFPNGFPLVPSLAVGGQGTQTSLQYGTLIAGAGVGIAFTADLLGRRLRLKPSFEYLRSEVKAEGVYQNVTGAANDPNKVFSALQRTEDRALDSVGGGLELEMDTLRAGPFMVSLLLNGQIYSLLGDREIHMSASDGTNTVRWEVTLDRAIYRASAGMRFRFVPGS